MTKISSKMDKSNPTVLNLSGPYAVGKDTILNALLERFEVGIHRVSTITTRPVSRVADPTYTHVESDEFESIVRSGNWIANYQLKGHAAYATNLDEIDEATNSGLVCVLSVFAGPQGAGALRAALGQRLVSLAVMPSDGAVEEQLSVLRQRLIGRNRDAKEAIDRRLASQMEPISYILQNPSVASPDGVLRVFDSVVVNQDLHVAIDAVCELFANRFLGGEMT